MFSEYWFSTREQLMAQSNLKLIPKIEIKRFFVQVVNDSQPTQQFEIDAATLPKARREAVSFLSQLNDGQGWVELYERTHSKPQPLLIWVGVV
jgi:hypothetical protein